MKKKYHSYKSKIQKYFKRKKLFSWRRTTQKEILKEVLRKKEEEMKKKHKQGEREGGKQWEKKRDKQYLYMQKPHLYVYYNCMGKIKKKKYIYKYMGKFE